MITSLAPARTLSIRQGSKVVTVYRNRKLAKRAVARLVEDRKDGEPIALDFETTGLDTEFAQVRLTSISGINNQAIIIDHAFCGGFDTWAEPLAKASAWYVFNNKFEGSFFDWWSPDHLVELLDVGIMRKSVLGGGHLDLALQCKYDLGVKLDKEEQLSDWSGELSSHQYLYAGKDAIYTYKLGVYWSKEMTDDHWRGFRIINDAWRAVDECERTGLLLDVDYHRGLVAMWKRRQRASEKALRRLVNEQQISNLNSKKQISEFLKSVLDEASIAAWPKTEKTKQLDTSRAALTSMAYIAPYPLSRFLTALIVFNRASKYVSTYGETLITKQELSETGRIHFRLNMAQAVTCRFSSSGPNVQNMPSSAVVRRSFIAGKGKKLIIADYSGVEIRVLAEMSGDKILLHDCIYDDVHSQSAIVLYKEDREAFLAGVKANDPRCKELRRRAKAFTFQLLYGAGAAALAIVLKCSVEEAEEYIRRWAQRYQKAYNFRMYMFEKMNHSGFLPCVSGRTIYVRKQDRTIPVASNYPIQGSAGDVMYAAMTAIYDILYELDDPRIRMMVSVHDEMLLLADEEVAEQAKDILEQGMLLGWLKLFPNSNTDNLVDAAIGDTWADKK